MTVAEGCVQDLYLLVKKLLTASTFRTVLQRYKGKFVKNEQVPLCSRLSKNISSKDRWDKEMMMSTFLLRYFGVFSKQYSGS